MLFSPNIQWALLSVLLPLTLWRTSYTSLLHALGAGLLVYATLSLFWAVNPLDGIYGLWLLSIVALGFRFGSTLASLRRIYLVLGVLGAASSLTSIYQFFGHGLGWTLYPHCYTGLSPNWPCWYVSGAFFNPSVQGACLAMIAVALLSERMWILAGALLPGLLLSGSRGAIAIVVIGAIACWKRRTFWALSATALFFFFGSIVFGPTDADRVQIWHAAWTLLTPFGNGVGSFDSMIYFGPLGGMHPRHAHNDYLQLAFEYGFFALLPFSILLAGLLRPSAREWPVLVAFAVLALFYFPFYLPIPALLGALAAGRIAAAWLVAWDNLFTVGYDVSARGTLSEHEFARICSEMVPVGSGLPPSGYPRIPDDTEVAR